MSKRISISFQLRLNMLGSVLEFMNASGMDESEIREMFETCMRDFSKRSSSSAQQRGGKLRIGNENVCAELLRMWHRDSRYIDDDAKPRPLLLDKGRNSLQALARRIDATVNATQVLLELKAVKLIRKTSHGRYLPNSESAIVGRLHPLATDHIAKLVIRLMSTVSRNVDPSGKSLKLIEMHAYAPDLDWSERAAFAEFTRLQGMAHLESVDNWLEQRRLRRIVPRERRNRKSVAASVHLFAFLGDDEGIELLRAPGAKDRATRSGSIPAANSSKMRKSNPARATRA